MGNTGRVVTEEHTPVRDVARAAPGSERGSTTAPVHLLALQRSVGNRAVAALLDRPSQPTVQREAPGDAGPTEAPITPLADVTATATSTQGDAENEGRTLSLRGLTRAEFSQSTNAARTENVSVSRGQGCTCAQGDPCVTASATVICDYSVPINVTLPTLPSNLNECERQRAQTWIDTVLAPHEQQHVRAFEAYNGSTTRQLRFSACNSAAQGELATRVQSMLDSEQASRQASAQQASDALDPFNTTIDIDGCDQEGTQEATEEQEGS